MEEKRVSKAEYARLRGTTRQAVHAAMKTGRIAAACGDDGLVDVALAEKLWADNTDPRYQPLKTKKEREKQAAMAEDAERRGIVLGTGIALAESKQIEAEYKAKLAKLDYEERSGKLIDAEAVRKEAFRVARITRDAMLAIPDRLAAELAGITDPFACHAKMMAEIRGAIAEVAKNVADD